MLKKQLGKTDIYIPTIGQGTMGAVDSRYISFAIEQGATFIDTAECYGTEEAVGRAIDGKCDKVTIATKVSPENLHYDDVIKACEGSLKRLNTDYIDLYQIHWPNPSISIEETLTAMISLQEQGKIGEIGVCNFSLQQLQKALVVNPCIVSNQVEYNAFDRGIEKHMLPYCEDHAITLIAYSPLDQGHLHLTPYKFCLLQKIAVYYAKTPLQIVLNWLVNRDNVVAIPKASSVVHILQNIEASDFKLTLEHSQIVTKLFNTTSVDVPVDRIRVVLDGEEDKMVYQTIDEAIRNPLNFCPSPIILAKDIRDSYEGIKPVKVRKTKDDSGRYDYDLIEGRIRYWAWVLAYEGKRDIPVLIRQISR